MTHAGLWHRSLLVTENGLRDETTDVRWLQGDSLFLDLRRPAVTACAGATVEGFAGTFGPDGERHTWTRWIDLHPPGPDADTATLTGDDGLLIETGWHAPYVEHWRRDPQPTAPRWGLALTRTGSGYVERAIVLRVGPYAGWAISRAPSADTPVAFDHTVIGLVVHDAGCWRLQACSDAVLADGRIVDPVTVLGGGWTEHSREGRLPPGVLAALVAAQPEGGPIESS